MRNTKSFDIRNNDVELLAPFVRDRAKNALSNAQKAGFDIAIFEGYRSPYRQENLYASSRTAPGKWLTDARAWRSWHQYGLALDIAFYENKKWNWNGDFVAVSKFFLEQKFEWIPKKEMVHFQITGKMDVDEAYKITQEFGVQTLWELIRSKIT